MYVYLRMYVCMFASRLMPSPHRRRSLKIMECARQVIRQSPSHRCLHLHIFEFGASKTTFRELLHDPHEILIHICPIVAWIAVRAHVS